MFVCVACRLDQDQLVLPPHALVSVFVETLCETRSNNLASFQDLRLLVSESFPIACFCVEVFEVRFSSLWGRSFLNNVSKAEPNRDTRDSTPLSPRVETCRAPNSELFQPITAETDGRLRVIYVCRSEGGRGWGFNEAPGSIEVCARAHEGRLSGRTALRHFSLASAVQLGQMAGASGGGWLPRPSHADPVFNLISHLAKELTLHLLFFYNPIFWCYK